ncbi:hypothetical protein [Acidipropionibacterium acidipropionici]|uniref:hypothetical protein n=1 Tax=Acidipropionibacterium acidipropionici TaxID=1748 RepID=UPI00110A22CA|nr:hypothetical protein [Acidipropionibacterium acidipropionici]QCV94563.1 hypothetical protein FEZ30_04090 [Acidipropionibacterium acidipropionici]
MVQLSPTPSGSGPTSNRGSGPASGLGPRGPLAALERRRLEAAPLITWYRGRDRVELSGRTVGSWVAKTVHLLTEEGIAPETVWACLFSRATRSTGSASPGCCPAGGPASCQWSVGGPRMPPPIWM